MECKKQLTVSMSGFVYDPEIDNYTEALQELGCRYVEQLSHEVDYLIINHTCTEKYKIAELSRSTTECLSLNWLLDSKINSQCLSKDKYIVKKVFHGVRVILQGFEDKKMEKKIVQILTDNGAIEVKLSLQGMLSSDINEKYQLILVPSVKFYRKIEEKISELLTIPAVTPEWLQESLKFKKCKYPNDFALNLYSLNTRPYDDNTNIRRLSKKLQNLMEQEFLNPSSMNIFCDSESAEPYLIYIDPNSIESVFIDVLKKLICVCGGLYLNTYVPVVTHVVMGVVDEDEFHKFFGYGDYGHVLRVEWLIDSILFSERLPEVDFKIRSFKPSLIKSMNNLEMRDGFNQRYQHSQTLAYAQMSQDTNPMKNEASSLPIQSKKLMKSISMSKEAIKPATKVLTATKTKATKSQIFKSKYFYIERSQKKDLTMISTYTKIKENGGSPLSDTSLKLLNKTKLYVVLRDSEKNLEYLNETNQLIGNDVELIPVSFRWIDECIKKMRCIEIDSDQYLTFKPFSFPVPVREMITMKIELLGIEDSLKRKYRELLVSLGVNKVCPNMAEITHCLCGKSYKTDSRFMAIQEAFQTQEKEKDSVTKEGGSNTKTSACSFSSNIKYISIEWLFEFMKNKGKCSIEEYLIEITESLNNDENLDSNKKGGKLFATAE